MKKKLILLVAITTLLCGCGKTIPKLENGQEAVVTFKDGSMISIDELYGELKDSAATKLIEMIDKKLLEEKYAKDLDDAKEYAENTIAGLKNSYTDENGYYNEAKLVTDLNRIYGYSSVEEYQETVRISYLRDKEIESYVESTIKNKEIEKYYKNEIVADRTISHIQIIPVTTDSMTSDEKKAAEENALSEAKAVIAKLKKGEKFEDLAKEYSDDEATKEKGGSLGDINKGTYGSDEFDKEAFSLKVGSYSTTPVKTTKGYEIIYVSKEQDKKPLKDLKEEIIEKLRDEKLREDNTLQVTAMTEFRKEYGVDIVDSEIEKNYDNYVDALINSLKANSSSN